MAQQSSATMLLSVAQRPNSPVEIGALGDEQVTTFTDPVEELVNQSWLDDCKKVRVIASPYAAKLICLLHGKQQRMAKPWELQVNYCRACRSNTLDTVDPQDLRAQHYRELSVCRHAPSLGGWHTFLPTELPQYRLAWLLNAETPDDVVQELLYAHPAAPALQFCNALTRTSGMFLGTMTDPRWFADAKRPESQRLMRDLLGVRSVKRARKFLEGDDEFFENDTLGHIAKIVFSSWNSGRLYGNPQYVVDELIEPTFLWEKYLDLRSKGQPEVGLVKSTTVFLKFLTSVWLDRLTPARKYTYDPMKKVRRMEPNKVYQPTLFVPQYFFGDALVARKWAELLRAYNLNN